jgi:hypothetical protein
MRYVYAGNIAGESDDTTCPTCKQRLIERSYYRVLRTPSWTQDVPTARQRLQAYGNSPGNP